MAVNQSRSTQAMERAMAEIARLRQFAGQPQAFWQAYMAATGEIAGAAKAVLVLQDPKQAGSWRKLGEWSGNTGADRGVLAFNNRLADLAQQCLQQGNSTQVVDGDPGATLKHVAVSVRLRLQRAEDVCIAVFLLCDTHEAAASEVLTRLQLIADVPASYQSNSVSNQAKSDVEKFASTLDLMVLVNAEKKFLAAGLALCNGVAARYNCDRVSLGWLEKGFIRLKNISRTERFERKMEAAQALEVAMEEALDQDEEIVFPPNDGTNFISKDHEAFSKAQSVPNIASIPIRNGDKPMAVLTLERQSGAFNFNELQQLRLTCDQAATRLSDLYREDRWIGSRLMLDMREKMAGFLGPENTWAKALGILIAVVLLAMLIPVWNYRVEGNFILKSEEVSFLTAPFDGYIRSVSARPGDEVNQNQVLLNLNTIDLELEESAAKADLSRYLREAERARATNALAEMRISQAQAEQVQARLALVRYRLEQSAIKSPFKGVVAEGDLRQKIGAPVRQGEGLFRISRTDSLYVEAEVDEREIHNVRDASIGQIAFLSQPKLKYDVKISRIEPAGVAKRDNNVFVVRCSLSKAPEAWFRPGMSGVCKLESGRRSLLWILTHRTVDFLRLKLWW